MIGNCKDFLGYMICHNHLVKRYKHPSQRALEVGPGDNHSLALMLAAVGYKKIDTIDKYQVNYDIFPLYEEISITFILSWKTLITRLTIDPRLDLAHLVADKQHHYDLIYSVSVIEHLWPWKIK